MTLPSFLAAAISSGVMAVGGGASARAGAANTEAAAAALAALITSRLENRLPRIAFSSLSCFIVLFHSLLCSAEQRPAALGRQREPDFCALRNALLRRRDGAHLRAVAQFDHVVAAVAEEDVAGHGPGQHIIACRC